MTAAQHIEAMRFVAWTLEAGCAAVALHYVWLASASDFRLPHHHRLRVALGLVVKCSGWAVHQFYWWVWQAAHNHGNIDAASAMVNSSAVTILAYLMIFSGEALVVSPWLERVAGTRHWPVAAVGVVVVLWVFGALLSNL